MPVGLIMTNLNKTDFQYSLFDRVQRLNVLRSLKKVSKSEGVGVGPSCVIF